MKAGDVMGFALVMLTKAAIFKLRYRRCYPTDVYKSGALSTEMLRVMYNVMYNFNVLGRR